MFQNSRTAAFATLAIVGLVAAAAAPARAETSQSRTQMVKVGDLDLHTADGQATLRHRVKVAARSVCGPAEMLGSSAFDSYDRCLDQAQKQAMVKVDAMVASASTGERVAMATPSN